MVQIANGAVLTPGGMETATVVLSDRSIEAVTADPVANHPAIDGSGLIVAPGFIDLQINGGYGFDLVDDPDSMWELGRLLPRTGVTSFLPTIISSAPARTDAALAAIGRRPVGYLGADPLGLHFEGPMLNPDRRGAHPLDRLRAPDRRLIADWSADSGVALVTLAPELPGASAVITDLVGRGVVVSAGHSDASADEARTAVADGVTMVTHLFNAMAPLGHRQPNLVGFTLSGPALTAGLIVDGVHVDPIVVAAAWNAKGPDGIALVTDAVAAMGRDPGVHRLGGSELTADGVAVRNRAGTLAGSLLTMDRAVRNLIDYTGCPVEQALRSASATPAAVLGRSDRGRLAPGATADLVLLGQDLDVMLTVCGGRVAFVADGARHRVPDALLQ